MKFPAPYDYRPALTIPLASVPVTTITLTKNEEANISRCLRTTAWASQRIVVDSGSSDRTVSLAQGAGAEVLQTHWRGFGDQREWALSNSSVKNEWVLFVDADEWISNDLANEISQAIANPEHSAYGIRFRLVFLGRWIAHCGWYPSAEKTVLVHKKNATYAGAAFAEHPIVDGSTGTLVNELVDDDLKPFSAWLKKHVDYAPLEAARQLDRASMRVSGSLINRFLKKVVAPRVPMRPLVQFLYMYIARKGFLDGREGLLFCFMHAWFQTVVAIEKRSLQSRLQ